MTKRLGVAAILIDPERPYAICLGRRGKDPNRGLYVLPGGGIEPGEAIWDALVREVREETGLEVDQLFPMISNTLEASSIELDDRIILIRAASVKNGRQLKAGSDLYDVGWWDINNLPPMDEISPVVRTLLYDLAAKLSAKRRWAQHPTSIHEQVLEFMQAFQPEMIRRSPVVPSDDIVRLRLRIIFEEAFEALMAANFDVSASAGPTLSHMRELLERILSFKPRVNLVQFADALADLDYVSEGARIAFGIDGAPIAAEVHRSNMSKVGGHRRADGKWQKPPTWSPPDIEGELKKQRQQNESHCMHDPSVIGCCAGPGRCSCECNTCLCPLCGENPCECPPGTFSVDP